MSYHITMKTITLTLVLDEINENRLLEALSEGNDEWTAGMVRIKKTKSNRKDLKLRAEGMYEKIGYTE